MILVAAVEAPLPKSDPSSRTVFRPRNCESSAEPDPVAPAPMTQTSNVFVTMLSSASRRLFTGPLFPLTGVHLQAASSKQHADSKSQNAGVPALRIRPQAPVVLIIRLQHPPGSDLKQVRQLHSLFRSENRETLIEVRRIEGVADFAVDQGRAQRIAGAMRKQPNIASAECCLRVQLVHISRAVIIREKRVEPLARAG